MRCFSCINNSRKRLNYEDERLFDPDSPSYSHSPVLAEGKQKSPFVSVEHQEKRAVSSDDQEKAVDDNINDDSAHSFTFRELAVATKNFRESQLIGEGGFGKVYKGRLDDGHIIAAKRLNLDSLQGNQEFIVEVLMLSLLHHPHLVTLIGYCAEGDQRLLVYEYMPKGSLADHLFGLDKDVLDWNTRIKIAAGAARGLEHLHCVAKPPVIYRDLKSANILLDDDFNPKLSDFGLAKLGPVGDKTHVSTRVMGTYGYCAPEYALSGKLTIKSDIFSFGVLLLEIVTGRKAFDVTKRHGEQSLAVWSHPYLKDRRKYIELVDPRLRGRFSARSARHFIAVTAMCLNEEPSLRPSINDIVVALDFLANECQSPPSASSNDQTPPRISPSKPEKQVNPFSATMQHSPKEHSPKQHTDRRRERYQ